MAKRAVKTGAVMTESRLMLALRERYPSREFALLEQVRNGTGFGRQPRTADAIALSLWPSRGLVLHGFEIKQYRGDWKREKDAPEKAEEIARFCDYWWLVVTDARIVEPGEIPATWGLLAPDDQGKRLVAVREPAKLDAQPWTRAFMSAVLRKAGDSMTPTAAVNAMLEKARQEGFEEGKGSSPENEAERELKTLRTLQEKVQAFDRASGLRIEHGWDRPEQIGDAVQAVLSGRQAHARYMQEIASLAKNIPLAVEREFESLRRAAQILENSLNLHAKQLQPVQEV